MEKWQSRWLTSIALLTMLTALLGAGIPTAVASPRLLFANSRFFEEPDFSQKDFRAFLLTQPGTLATLQLPCGTAGDAIYYAGNTFRYSINAKLLLTLVEMCSGLLTQPYPTPDQIATPMGLPAPTGFEMQLAYVAESLVNAYYAYIPGATISFADGSLYTVPAETNAASYAIMTLLAAVAPSRATWEEWTNPESGTFVTTFERFFGAGEPPVPIHSQFPGDGDPAFLYQPYTGNTVNTFSYLDHKYPTYSAYPNNTYNRVVIYTGDDLPSCTLLPPPCYWYDGHDGYDYSSYGRDVVAAADGIVDVVYINYYEPGWSDWCSYPYTPVNAVIINHDPDGDGQFEFKTRYWHLASIAVNPSTGQAWATGDAIQQGMTLGPTGSTGCSSGPHLHFAVRRGGVQFDQYGWGGGYDDPWGPWGASFWLWANSNASYAAETMSIDSPAPNAHVGGTVQVSGWAINRHYGPNSGVDRVVLYLDDEARTGQYLGEATYGDYRPDVGNAFGDQRFDYSGFHFDWDSNSVPVGTHTLYVYAHSVRNNNWFFQSRTVIVDVDTVPPHNPTAVDPGFMVSQPGCPTNGNNCWQNVENDPNFTWSGAWDARSGILGYYYYWGDSQIGDPTTWTTSSGFDPGPITDPTGSATYYLRVRTEDTQHNISQPETLYILKYDGSPPTAAVLVNNGALTTTQVDVTLNLTVGDTGSGVGEMRASNNNVEWSPWQPYGAEMSWTLPALDRRELPVYVQVRDRAGNESPVVSDTIFLDFYPPPPHGANYRICGDVWDAAGGRLTSANYLVHFALGQPAQGRAESNAYTHDGGFLAMDGCLPITIPTPLNFTITQWVIAAGGNLRASGSYRVGDTAGEPAASAADAFSSTNYVLSSGFWASGGGMVPPPPPTGTVTPTPRPPPPTPATTPTPTPTPPPGNFGIQINGSDLYTNDRVVTVTARAPNVTHMRLSNDSVFQDNGWFSYRLTSTWVLSATGEPLRTVYAWFRDAESTVYGPYLDDITYDPDPPVGGVQVLGGGEITVTLWLYAYDDLSGVDVMRVSDTVTLTLVPWQPYAQILPWVLHEPVVYAQYRDRAGNESVVYSSEEGGGVLYRIYLPLVMRND